MTSKLATVIADFTTQLATAMQVGATTVSLQSATDDDGNALPAGVYFFAIDGNNSQKEHIVCTLSGTSLTNISSVSRQGVQTSGCARTHRIGSSVTLTDFAHLRYINDILSGATGLDHSNPLAYDGSPSLTTANQFATKGYVDGVAIAGGANASSTLKGITKLSIDPVSSTNPIAVGDNDTRVPTASQAAALVGTSGTSPSGSNKFVDNADTGTSGAGKVLRLDGSGKLPAIDGSQLSNLSVSFYSSFTSSGTWTKPNGLTGNELVFVQLFGGGGGGGGSNASNLGGAGGGGGAYVDAIFRASDLGSTETVTVDTGGTAGTTTTAGGTGGASTFGSHLSAYGGGGGAKSVTGTGGGSGGGGAGTMGAGGAGSTGSASDANGGGGGSPAGGTGGTGASAGSDAAGFGGAGGGPFQNSTGIGSAGGSSMVGGGGGGGSSNGSLAAGNGGNSIKGGGGGAGGAATGGTAGTGGTSKLGGAGGAGGHNGAGTSGSAPAGGGGGGCNAAGGAGARGECRVWVFQL